MKTLLLMRHAKSSWDDLFCPDHDRTLSARGQKAALDMAGWLSQNDLNPDAVLLSSAKRVQETWELLCPQLASAPSVNTVKNLYMTNADLLLAHIRNTKKTVQTLLVINHEPTLSNLTAQLSTSPLPPSCARALQKFPTAAIARFDMADKWSTLSRSTAKFSQFVKPKNLQS